jgi:hypothetical protein
MYDTWFKAFLNETYVWGIWVVFFLPKRVLHEQWLRLHTKRFLS